MVIEKYSQAVYGNLAKMDHNIDKVKSLKGAGDNLSLTELQRSKEQAFEGFYDATRTLTRTEDGDLHIAVDREIVSIASGRLLQRGIPQFLRHQVLENFDSRH